MIKKAFLPAVAFVLLTGALHCRSAQIYSENLRKEERNVGWSRRAGSMLGTSSFHGADRRMLAIEVELPIEALDEGGTGPDLALKSKSGENLGYSVSATGRTLQLSFVGNAIMSAHANRGGFFYEANYGLMDHVIPSNQMARGTVSDDLACFVQERANDVSCYVLQLDVLADIEARLDLSIGSVWVQATPALKDSSCGGAVMDANDDFVCKFGDGVAAWKRAVAVSGGFANSRYVQTYFVEEAGAGGGYLSRCSACEKTTGNLTSTNPTWGDSLALSEHLLIVGAPSSTASADGMVGGTGSVSVFAAVGRNDGSGYGHHRNWALRKTLTAEGNFGHAVSVGPEFVVVGAPGNATFPAKLHIYRITGSGASSNVEEFCVVTHPEPWTYRSRMGSAIDQASDGVFTWVVAGAPGGNVAYTVLLRGPQHSGGEVCRFGDTLAPPLLDFMRSDEFGFSVAMTASQYIFVGAPYYSRWYRQEKAGLVYALAYCFPGSRILVEGGLRSCVPCARGLNSGGGMEEQCTPCAEPIPGNSTFVFGCNYQCNSGYVFPDCVICSEAKAQDPTAVLPPNAHWKDYAPECALECDGGFYMNLTTMRDCISCPQFSKDILEEQPNREWILGEECTTRCQRGFFEDVTNDVCMPCSQKNRDLELPAPNTEWVDGLAVCTWIPQLGFRADRQNVNVTACPPKPRNAHWISLPPALVDSRCDFECDLGFHGPALGLPGVCELCSVVLTEYVGFTLPNNARWLARNDTCGLDSFVCDATFSRSTLTAFCCPPEVNNSRPNPNYSPCGVECLEGYYWDNATASCKTCTAPLVNARWKRDCDFECLPEYFGREDVGECLLCSDYAERKGWVAPFNAWYPQQVLRCGQPDWVCLQGRADYLAVPPGCCPLRTTIPVSDTAFDLTSPGSAETCGYRCNVNFVWNPMAKNCSSCPNVAPQVRPANSEWNYVGECYFRCRQGFVSLPLNATVPSECVDCADFAAQQGWELPSNASWKTSSMLADDEQCSPEAWDCLPGLTKNPEAGLCCVSSQLPDTTSPRGSWDDDSCQWQCDRGYFPAVPRPGDRPACSTCRAYMERYCAENAECRLSECDNDLSFHCFDDLAPRECTFAVFLTLVVQGVSRANFTAAASTRAVRRELAQLLPGGSEQHVMIVGIEDYDGALRRSDEEEGEATHRSSPAGRELLASHVRAHRVRLHLAGVYPPTLAGVSDSLRRQAGNVVGSALKAVGVGARATLLGGLEVRPSADTVKCAPGYQMNAETRTCCLQEFFNDPRTIDPSRYTWQDNGCKFDCLPSLIGSQCLTCTQYSENKFKPENSIWDDASPNCTWMCRAGYVKSSTGYECRSIKNLASLCSENKRCATCVAHENRDLCVWCNGECVPGEHLSRGVGCPFLEGGELGGCTCDSETCSNECNYDSCGDCVQDAFCGWCGATGQCMLGSYFSPLAGSCPGEWSTGINTRCTAQTGIWLVGLVCASVSTLLVGLMCCYFVLRVRAAQRSQQVGLERFGVQPAGVNATRAQELTERFLATFPTFKYNAAKVAPKEEKATRDDDDDDEEEEEENYDDPCCSICLGNFTDGEECRMLPCLHVFHRACIDQWLTVSVECPLCKRSVLGEGAEQPSAAFVEAQRRYNPSDDPTAPGIGAGASGGAGTVTGDVSFQMALNNGAPAGPPGEGGPEAANRQEIAV